MIFATNDQMAYETGRFQNTVFRMSCLTLRSVHYIVPALHHCLELYVKFLFFIFRGGGQCLYTFSDSIYHEVSISQSKARLKIIK